MEQYLIEIRDLKDLSKYITLLESFKLRGEIHIEHETLYADDILLMCEKCISRKVWLKVTEGEKRDENSILEYLRKNNLLVSGEGE